MGKLVSSSIPTLILVVAVSCLADGIASAGVNTAYAQSDTNSSDLGVPMDDPAADLGLSQDNSTNTTSGTSTNPSQASTVTTPEFGSMTPIILVISIVSIVILSARTRLGFS